VCSTVHAHSRDTALLSVRDRDSPGRRIAEYRSNATLSSNDIIRSILHRLVFTTESEYSHRRTEPSASRATSSRLTLSPLCTPSPRFATPHVSTPNLASPRFASPRLASPRLASSRFVSLRLAPLLTCFSSSRVASRHVASPPQVGTMSHVPCAMCHCATPRPSTEPTADTAEKARIKLEEILECNDGRRRTLRGRSMNPAFDSSSRAPRLPY